MQVFYSYIQTQISIFSTPDKIRPSAEVPKIPKQLYIISIVPLVSVAHCADPNNPNILLYSNCLLYHLHFPHPHPPKPKKKSILNNSLTHNYFSKFIHFYFENRPPCKGNVSLFA